MFLCRKMRLFLLLHLDLVSANWKICLKFCVRAWFIFLVPHRNHEIVLLQINFFFVFSQSLIWQYLRFYFWEGHWNFLFIAMSRMTLVFTQTSWGFRSKRHAFLASALMAVNGQPHTQAAFTCRETVSSFYFMVSRVGEVILDKRFGWKNIQNLGIIP